MQKRLVELDVLRALAVIGVILTHTGSKAMEKLEIGGLNFQYYFVVNQLLRFSVPLFVAISGYALNLKYYDSKLSLKDFFTKRILRILPWYFFFSALIFGYLFITGQWQNSQQFPWWKVIFLGKADYHLYFVPMIFQLYVMFPVLLFVYKKIKWGLVLLSLLLQGGFYYLITLYISGQIELPTFLNDQQQYLFFGTWIFYFVLGIALTKTAGLNPKIKRFLKVFSIALTFLGLAWVFYDAFILLQDNDAVVATRATRLPVLLYAGGFIMTSGLFMEKFILLPKKLLKLLYEIGERSYIIYLVHTLMIRVFANYLALTINISYVTVSALTIVSSDYIAYLLGNIASFINKEIFGKVRRVDTKV